MISIIATTTNRHKFHEIRKILDLPQIELRSLSDYSGYPEVEESGSTFEENAAIKARAYYGYLKRPVFADDSGLEVAALNNEPGVFSARYAGPDSTYADNNRLLIEKISCIAPGERTARFVCTVCYKDDEGEYFFTGTTNGIILDHLRGKEGFGYDPLFYVPKLKKTFAELDTEEKNKYSHRGKVIRQLRFFLIKKFALNSSSV